MASTLRLVTTTRRSSSAPASNSTTTSSWPRAGRRGWAFPGDHAALDAAVDLEHLGTEGLRDQSACLQIQAFRDGHDRPRAVREDAPAPDELGQVAKLLISHKYT